MDCKTPGTFKTRFTGMIDRLVEREWLKDYSYEEGKGSQLTWTNRGAMRALLLNQINRKYGLSNKETLFAFAVQVIKETNGKTTTGFDPFDANSFWKLCIDELSLPLDVDELVAFANVTYLFGPEQMYGLGLPSVR